MVAAVVARIALFCGKGTVSSAEMWFQIVLPTAAGVVALFFAYEAVEDAGTFWSSAFLATAPFGVALTVMPGIYYLIYRFDALVAALRIRRKYGLTH